MTDDHSRGGADDEDDSEALTTVAYTVRVTGDAFVHAAFRADMREATGVTVVESDAEVDADST